jgi:hypothetical protein
MCEFKNKLVVSSKIENMSYKSVILILQAGLFKLLNPDIILNYHDNGHTLIASNINERDIKNVQFVTNNPSFNGVYMSLVDVQVTLDNNYLPTPVYGLYEILNERVKIIDAISYSLDKKTYYPFNVNFPGGSVPQLTDTLSGLSSTSTNTFGHIKRYTLKFRNDNNTCSPSPQPEPSTQSTTRQPTVEN